MKNSILVHRWWYTGKKQKGKLRTDETPCYAEKSIAPKYVGAVKPSMAIATKLTKRSLPMGKKSSLNPTKRPVKYQDYQ